MRASNTSTFSNNSFIKLKDKEFLNNQRIAGRVAAQTLLLLEKLVKEKTTKSLLELDKIAGEFIINNGCEITFLNYKGFPNNICISVNKQLVHGIATDYKLQDGDLVSFDLGATYRGAIADTAITCIYGNPISNKHIELINATNEALYEGIKAISINKRLGSIGNAISKYVKNKGYGLITNYGGHGLDLNIPHAQPFVSNKSDINEGIRFTNGLTLAIEPMLTSGPIKTWTDNDGWTVWCDAEISAHCEHTIHINENNVEIITDRSQYK